MSIIEKALEKAERPEADRPVQPSPESAGSGVAPPGGAMSAESAVGPEMPPAAAPADRGDSGDGSIERVDTGGATDFTHRKPERTISLADLHLDGFISPEGDRSRMADAFRVIKRPILISAFEQSAASEKPGNLVMVTSAVASEGKTFVSLNMAISIAQEFDRWILLVDADVAKPGLSRLMQLEDRPGLLDVLSRPGCTVSDVLIATDMPKLSVIPAGGRHRHATELLASNGMKQFLLELAQRYPDRLVLFDSPPMLPTTEASVLARQMGQVVMVVEAERTARSLVKEAIGQLDSTENVALVLNKTRPKFGLRSYYGGYYYYYGRYYGQYGE